MFPSTNNTFRFSHCRSRCLRITQKEEKVVRAKLNAKYKTIESRKDGTKFTNRPLENAADRLSAVSAQYEELQKELVEQVVSVAHTFVEIWETVAGLLAELDVLLGFADLAVTAPSRYARPVMLPPEAGEITLIGSRHPCVEAQVGRERKRGGWGRTASSAGFLHPHTRHFMCYYRSAPEFRVRM